MSPNASIGRDLRSDRLSGVIWSRRLHAVLATILWLTACGGSGDAGVAPTITSQPADQTVAIGTAASFSVTATGTPPLAYQWQSSSDTTNYTSIPNATAATYTIASVSLALRSTVYRVLVSNSSGNVASADARLTVTLAPSMPSFAIQPGDQRVAVGARATFSVGVEGFPPPTLQWQQTIDGGTNWSNIPGATSGEYVTPPVERTDNGKRFRAVASNSAGATASTAARLVVAPFPASLSCTGPNERGWCKMLEQIPEAVPALKAVARVTESTLVAVGERGTILRSTDAGRTWTRVASGTTDELRSVSFSDSSFGLAAGTSTTILRTNDGGVTWSSDRDRVPFGNPLNTIAAPQREAGIAFGPYEFLVRGVPGAWDRLRLEPFDIFSRLIVPTAVAFVDAQNGLLVGETRYSSANYVANNAAVFRTVDRGRSWQEVKLSGGAAPNEALYRLNAVAYGNSSNAIAVGNGPVNLLSGARQSILRSEDGGSTWQSVNGANGASLFGVSFATPSIAVAVGQRGTVLRSADSGRTWTETLTGDGATLNAVAFASQSVGVAVGDGAIFRTEDGGVTWTPVIRSAIPSLFSAATSGDAALAVGSYGNVYRSADRGRTWTQMPIASADNLIGVVVGTAGTAYAVGSDVLSQIHSVLVTQDSARSWSILKSSGFTRLAGISPFGVNRALIFADQAGIQSVALSDPPTLGNLDRAPIASVCRYGYLPPPMGSCSMFLRSAALSTATTGVAVGDLGAIVRTVDAGQTWTAITQPTPKGATLNKVAFANATEGVAVGESGVILRTADGGLTWTTVPSGRSETLRSVAMTATGIGFAVGEGGTILRTADSARSWSLVFSGTHVNLNAVILFTDLHGIVVGDDSTILVTETSGLP